MKAIKGLFNKKNPEHVGLTKTSSTTPHNEDVNSHTQIIKAIPSAINYLVFWVDKNVDSDENKSTLRQLHIMGYRIFALSSIEKTQELIDKLIKQKKDHLEKYPSRKYFANSIIIMSSGQLKEQAMSFMEVWRNNEALENKILKLIVYCGNVSYHQKSLAEHPDKIHCVINQVSEIPSSINDVITQNEFNKQVTITQIDVSQIEIKEEIKQSSQENVEDDLFNDCMRIYPRNPSQELRKWDTEVQFSDAQRNRAVDKQQAYEDEEQKQPSKAKAEEIPVADILDEI